MNLENEVDQHAALVARITTVARRSPGPSFGDLLWPPIPDVQILMHTWMNDPGVLFETDRRVVVFQRIGDELRYYAGGWSLSQERFVAEQDRIHAEGCELGVFHSVADALAFTEGYLVEEQCFGALVVPRELRYGRGLAPSSDT